MPVKCTYRIVQARAAAHLMYTSNSTTTAATDAGRLAQYEYKQEGNEEVEEQQQRPEDCIPDLPENKTARDFLKNAPTQGLHMPLGKQVKVMQCWKCKAYGHRADDKECPFHQSGNPNVESQRRKREDPMSEFVSQKDSERLEKYERVEQLRLLVEEIRAEERERKKLKQERKEAKREKKKKSKR